MRTMTDFQAYKIKMLEARLFEKHMDAIEAHGIYSQEYQETRVNWITAQHAVVYFQNLFPDVMKANHA